MKIKNREKLLTLGAALVIILLVGDSFILTPLTKAYKARNERIDKLKTDLKNAKGLLSNEKTLRNRWDLFKTNALPSNVTEAEINVRKSADRWVKQSGVTTLSYKTQWKSIEDEYVTLESQYDATGNMQSIARFLYELEKESTALRVEDLKIAPGRDNTGQLLTLGVRFTALQLIDNQK